VMEVDCKEGGHSGPQEKTGRRNPVRDNRTLNRKNFPRSIVTGGKMNSEKVTADRSWESSKESSRGRSYYLHLRFLQRWDICSRRIRCQGAAGHLTLTLRAGPYARLLIQNSCVVEKNPVIQESAVFRRT
jgi:hypothetical protein